MCKVLEKLIKKRINPNLKKVNILQAGSRTNRGPPDNLFLVNGAIDHAKYLNKQLLITFYDYTTCFDSLWLEDSMISLWNLGIQNELFALIFKLNEKSTIRVKTPFGMSDYFNSPRIVKQGSVLSSNLCSSSTAELCDTNPYGGTMVGSLLISSVLYVDDTTDLNEDVNETDESHGEIMNLSGSKRLSMNQPKCGILTINKKPHYTTPTLTIGDGQVAQIRLSKLLGDIVNEKGTNLDMIDDKVNSAKAAMVNSLALASDLTMGVHQLRASIVTYNSVFVQTLLSNCQAWTNLSNTDLKKLETSQLRYLKRAVRSPLSATNSFTFLEFGALPATYLIHCRQLSYLHHIHSLDDNDPVKMLYLEQQSLPYERNWTNHVMKLLLTYQIDILDVTHVTKETWKEKVKRAVTAKAFLDLTSDVRSKSKTENLRYSSLSKQSYFSDYRYKVACTIFKLRCRSIDCKANRKSSSGDDVLCRLCNVCEETQRHLINCPVASNGPTIDVSILEGDILANDVRIEEICSRVELFQKLVNECVVGENNCNDSTN